MTGTQKIGAVQNVWFTEAEEVLKRHVGVLGIRDLDFGCSLDPDTRTQ